MTEPKMTRTEEKSIEVKKITTQTPTGITVNININLPVTEDLRVYEKIFKTLRDVFLKVES